mmetsp:Transcript_9505/g.26587  ORF Transcript_9505/g.26587 Transcript_9505/m.26587 type:complete len:214 (-) Transcript_9505:986-1627(-)
MPVITFITASIETERKHKKVNKYTVEIFDKRKPTSHQSTPPEIVMNRDSKDMGIEPKKACMSSTRESPTSASLTYSATPLTKITLEMNTRIRSMHTAQMKGTSDVEMASNIRRRLRMNGARRKKWNTRKDLKRVVTRTTRRYVKLIGACVNASSTPEERVMRVSNMFHRHCGPTRNSPSEAKTRNVSSMAKAITKNASMMSMCIGLCSLLVPS